MIASENRKRFSPPIDADTLGDFFRRSRRRGRFETSCDKIAQPDRLAFLAISSNDRRKLRERAHLANTGEFKRRYLPCQISAILYADRGDRRKSQSLHRAHLAIKIAKCVAGFRKKLPVTLLVNKGEEFTVFKVLIDFPLKWSFHELYYLVKAGFTSYNLSPGPTVSASKSHVNLTFDF